MTTLKCALMGSKQVGKTTFVKRHQTGQFFVSPLNETGPTSLTFTTTHGPVTFEIQEYQDLVCEKSDCLLLMFDLHDPNTLAALPSTLMWQKDVPAVLCGTKCDLKDPQVTPEHIRPVIVANDIQYYSISSKSNYNYEKPFLYLARQCIDPNLRFTGATPV